MMAKHFPDQNEIRIYSITDLVGSRESSTRRLLKTNSMRKTKKIDLPIDWHNDHCAKICVFENKQTQGKDFVIKSRHCLRCSDRNRYFCQPEK